MTISERIFQRLDSLCMSQKELSERTGILQSTVSEWKKNKTNPSSDKILAICMVLDVTPEWLLSGIEPAGGRIDRQEYYVIDKESEAGELIYYYSQMDRDHRARMMGYASAIVSLNGITSISGEA